MKSVRLKPKEPLAIVNDELWIRSLHVSRLFMVLGYELKSFHELLVRALQGEGSIPSEEHEIQLL